MTQEDFADLLGVTYQQLQKYENGTNALSISRIWRVSQALGITPSHLCDIDIASEEGD
ncbi:helix-turn-helix transcriptional regulator [Kaistia sp. 32K]|uniref:helix-turn-helix domain-containing protein n=1 Tax=Kaistia sp. 32K TaxID=2795690 RepID=UPI001914FD57